MEIVCPQCGFAREVEPGQVPAGTVSVSCPDCGTRFPLPGAARDFVFEAEGSAGAPESAGAPPQPAYAGFWVRVVAALIDSCLVTLTQLVAGFLFIAATGALLGEAGSDELLLMGVTWLFASAVALGYYVVFTGHSGQTPGKMLLRLKVVRDGGGEIGYRTAFYREAVGKFLSALILGIGYLMVAFDPRKQGLHDRMAKTVVIRL